MRMTLLRKMLIFWMILWLPFAGAMAAVMPLTGTPVQAFVQGALALDAQEMVMSEAKAALVSDDFVMPCHTYSDSKSGATKTSLGQTCHHCVLCHLAGALALSSMPIMPQVPPTHVFAASPLLPHPSFFPEPVNPPPRRSLA
jgi:hypothetical protein